MNPRCVFVCLCVAASQKQEDGAKAKNHTEFVLVGHERVLCVLCSQLKGGCPEPSGAKLWPIFMKKGKTVTKNCGISRETLP